MAKLKIDKNVRMDSRIFKYLDKFMRRVKVTPPGACPIAVQLSLLEVAGAQSCGKCVPCRDGIPQLVALLRKVVDCDADEQTIEKIRELAAMVRDMSDCAIGYEAGTEVLEGLDAFADEYASHLKDRACLTTLNQTIPCERMCPAHVDIPGYIALVGHGDYAGAIACIRKDNPFPTACAYICEHPCEARCRRALIDAPLSIRGIKKFAVDQVPADQVPTPPRAPESGRRVAVVGGGPSGLTCAYYLSLMGHAVTVFEAREKLGGMMRYGIPAYRFPREKLDEDVNAILGVGGIEVRCGVSIDAATMKWIADEFDAVYVSIGAHVGKKLRVEGEDAEGVWSAVELLRAIGDGNYPDFTGKKVAVIGGGNVAMDCARTAIRSGAAEVNVVYRRRSADMTALPTEIESAMAEGVQMLTLRAPVRIEVDEQGRAAGVIVKPQVIGAIKNGRPAPRDSSRPEERIEADVVLIAIGQAIDTQPFVQFGMELWHGCLSTSEELEAYGFFGKGIFVGGECATGPATVIRAIGAGKVAARNIDEYLGYHHTLDRTPVAPEAGANMRTPTGRMWIEERPARERRVDFDFVEIPPTLEEVQQECFRCLRCDVYGCGALEGGRTQYV